MLGGSESCVLCLKSGVPVQGGLEDSVIIKCGKNFFDSSGRNGSDMNLVTSVQNSTQMSKYGNY